MTLYAMRRHKAWRGGSKAPLRGVPATALDLSLVIGFSGVQKSTKHQPKNDKKSTPKIDLGGVLGPETVFFALLVGLGCVLWATRGQHGRNLGPKMEPKSHKNQCQN